MDSLKTHENDTDYQTSETCVRNRLWLLVTQHQHSAQGSCV